MYKSNLGINLNVIAFICCVFAALQEPLLIILLLFYAVALEKNKWLTEQILRILLSLIFILLLRRTMGFFKDDIKYIDIGSFIGFCFLAFLQYGKNFFKNYNIMDAE